MNPKGSDFNFTKSSFSAENKEPCSSPTRFCHLSCEGPENTLKILLELWKVILFMLPSPRQPLVFCLLVQARASAHLLLTLYQSFPSTKNRLLWASCSRKWGHMWDDPPPFRHVYCDRKKEKNPRKHVNSLHKEKNHLKSKETGEGGEEGLWVSGKV